MPKVGTASNIAKLASKLLDNPRTSEAVKKVAASALTPSQCIEHVRLRQGTNNDSGARVRSITPIPFMIILISGRSEFESEI